MFVIHLVLVGMLLSSTAATGMVTIDNYDYTVTCTSGYLRWPNANSLCTALGSEWTMAAIRSASVNNALASMYSGGIWFGAKDVGEGSGLYQYMYGRWAGVTLSNGYSHPTCYQWCLWGGGEPDHVSCSGEGPQIYPLIIAAKYDGAREWDDVCTSANDDRSGTPCVACERSHCVQSLSSVRLL